MNSAIYQSTDYNVAAPSRANTDGRVATTITLVAAAACMFLAKSLVAPHPHPVQSSETPAVRIVDPDFCKNQTWPYIDARCLKRVAPDQPAVKDRAASVPTDPVVTPTAAPVPANVALNGAQANGSLSVSGASAKTEGALQNTPPLNTMNGAGQNETNDSMAPNPATAPRDNAANARIADMRRSRRTNHWRHGAFFGFRF